MAGSTGADGSHEVMPVAIEGTTPGDLVKSTKCRSSPPCSSESA
jgi:hypothetical protein